MRLKLALSLLCLLAISGCSKGRVGAGSVGTVNAGILYVSTTTAIQRYNSALTATGNIAPSVTISGAATTLSSPSRLLLDAASDRLFVANPGSSSILIFESISTMSGNAAPARTISGPSTLLASPTDLALDTVNNTLYVADGTRILAFLSASTVTGNVPPVHNISMGFSVGAILLDIAGNRLYVADTSGDAIDRLEGASAQDGAAVIAATISGISTGLAHPGGLALDGAGRLFVSNSSAPSITVYANASTLTGNVAPSATISGTATALGSPGQLVLNSTVTNGELYVADALSGGILVFGNITALNGNVAPTRSILGSLTGLAPNTVSGLALDTTR
jgi:DNA-binding beta-propeller fold protein YncE